VTESAAEALLSAIEKRLTGDQDSLDLDAALNAFRHRATEFVRGYHRLEIDREVSSLNSPVLFVGNHGFGGIFDLNVLAAFAALEDLDLDRPVTFLTHQLAWTLGVGPLIEHLGARPANEESATNAFAAGNHVVVFPGGDIDAGKSWFHRNEIVFGGRTGFARLAIEQRVPIVPIVTAGAGESLFVLTDGKPLAKALGLDRLLRVKALPISISLPWGLNVGLVGMLPYLPLPTKMHTKVLPAMKPRKGEDAESFAGRVHDTMQDTLTAMTARRRPVLG
jgi:1-acyl-sn-glycerol-3-phosphate acyltransferase